MALLYTETGLNVKIIIRLFYNSFNTFYPINYLSKKIEGLENTIFSLKKKAVYEKYKRKL